MSLDHVKAFYEKLVNDETFRTQVQSVETKNQCSQIVKAEKEAGIVRIYN
jgi:predicted ribosomally synthesized peptide with nif11-like leader